MDYFVGVAGVDLVFEGLTGADGEGGGLDGDEVAEAGEDEHVLTP